MKDRHRTMWKTGFFLFLTLAIFIGLAPTSQTYALERLSASIGKSAKLMAGGQTVELKVKVRCSTEDFEVLESFVYLGQDGNESDFGFFTPACGGNPAMQVFRVRVSAFDFPFHSGEATATAFILLINPDTQETTQIDARTTVQIK